MYASNAQSRWQPLYPWLKASIPGALRPWLEEQNSMTQRLLHHTKHHFRVQRLSEKHDHPLTDEAHYLQQSPSKYAWIREVLLYCDDVPWMWGRTVVPLASLRGELSRLRHLGDKPLGRFLFRDPQLQRTRLEYSVLSPTHAYYPTFASKQTLWARRSCFIVHSKPVLVTEVFLPGGSWSKT